MASTIEKIAARAGVAPATVSRVLNGKYKENRPAIARRADNIRRLAAEMGYRPNAAARAMLAGRFDRTAFVTCGNFGLDWFPRSLLHGLHEALHERKAMLIVNELSAEQFQDPRFVPNLLSESSVDGLVVQLNPIIPESVIPIFESSGLPIVWANLKRPVQSIYPDEVAGGTLAANLLLDAGHRHMAFFNPRTPTTSKPHFSAVERLAGFEAAVRARGYTPLPAPAAQGLRHDDITPSVHALLDAHPNLTGVVCYKTDFAATLFYVAAQRGLRVPQDLSVVCFGDREFHTYAGFPCTTLNIPFEELGRGAVAMLHRQMQQPHASPEPSTAVPYTDWYDGRSIKPPRPRSRRRPPSSSVAPGVS